MSFVIYTKNISKTFGSELCLDNINLEVTKGRSYGLVGPNGCGKSTLLKIILGLVRPSSGLVFVDGISLYENRVSCLRNIGAVLGNEGTYLDLSGRKNLQIVAQLYGVDLKNLERVEEQFGLTEAKDKKVRNYSYGMKQRLSIACAVLANPEILILDEPTNGLDSFGIVEIKRILAELSSKGITLLITSHILSDIDVLCQDLGVMKGGKLVYQGSTNAIKSDSKGSIYIQGHDLKAANQILKLKFSRKMVVLQSHTIIEEVEIGEDEYIKNILRTSGIKRIEVMTKPPSLESAIFQKVLNFED